MVSQIVVFNVIVNYVNDEGLLESYFNYIKDVYSTVIWIAGCELEFTPGRQLCEIYVNVGKDRKLKGKESCGGEAGNLWTVSAALVGPSHCSRVTL